MRYVSSLGIQRVVQYTTIMILYLGVCGSHMLHNIRYVCSRQHEVAGSIESSCVRCVSGVCTERVGQAVAVFTKSLDHVCHHGRREGPILNKLYMKEEM